MVEYQRDVKPILTARGCLDCHEGEFNFAPTATSSVLYREAAKPVWAAFDALHSPMFTVLNKDGSHTVTAEESRTIAEWIDTGGLLDTGEAFRDDTKPTLFIHSPRRKTQPITQVVVSAADANLNPDTLTVTLGGQPLTMSGPVDGVWTATVPQTASGELVASVKDASGNETRLTRTFTEDATSPPPPPPPPPDVITSRVVLP